MQQKLHTQRKKACGCISVGLQMCLQVDYPCVNFDTSSTVF